MACKHCNQPTLKKNGIYCSTACQLLFQRGPKETAFLDGKYVERHVGFKTDGWLKNLLIRLFGYKCKKCGISDYNDEPIVLEVNHIDGIATNNVISNLEFLCPNCHSQTPNFRAKNKVSVRTHRKPKAPVA